MTKVEYHKIAINHSHKGKSERENCPFWSVEGCIVSNIMCRYGLTNISVPKDCPMRKGQVTYTIKAKIIKCIYDRQ